MNEEKIFEPVETVEKDILKIIHTSISGIYGNIETDLYENQHKKYQNITDGKVREVISTTKESIANYTTCELDTISKEYCNFSDTKLGFPIGIGKDDYFRIALLNKLDEIAKALIAPAGK
jgi:regulator of replication initiation timing